MPNSMFGAPMFGVPDGEATSETPDATQMTKGYMVMNPLYDGKEVCGGPKVPYGSLVSPQGYQP